MAEEDKGFDFDVSVRRVANGDDRIKVEFLDRRGNQKTTLNISCKEARQIATMMLSAAREK